MFKVWPRPREARPTTQEFDDYEAEAEDVLGWRRVVLTVMSYLLFFSDIPRSGYGFDTVPFFAFAPHHYSSFGPYHYPIVKITHNYTTDEIEGAIGDTATSDIDVWVYKFDTTSIGMRAVIDLFAPLSWHDCLSYKTVCESSRLDLRTVSSMLEVLTTAAIQNATAVMLNMKTLYYDHLHHILIPGVWLKEKTWRVSHTYAFHRNTSTANIVTCHDKFQLTPPLYCQMQWSNFHSMGSEDMGDISDHINGVANGYELEANENLDVIVIETIESNRQDSGGFVDTGAQDYDIVALYRVQQRVNGTWWTKSIEDYRYEGTMVRTNTPTFYKTVRALRAGGQIYNIVRVLALFAGCYSTCSHPSTWRNVYDALQLGLRIPCQVVIYGSWLPVSLFAVAHIVDAPMLYCYMIRMWESVLGDSSMSPSTVMKIMTCHMRNVWILSLIVKATLLLYRPLHFQQHGIPGVRGYAIILASFLSMFFDIRLPAVRNTQLLEVTAEPPSVHMGILRRQQGLPFHLRTNGVWLDLKTLLFSCLLVGLILRTSGCIRLPTMVPQAVLVYSSPLMFSTSWSGALLDPLTTGHFRQHERPLGDPAMENMLKNLVWMTDPLQFSCMLWSDMFVYKYRSPHSTTSFYFPLPPKRLDQWKKASRREHDRVPWDFQAKERWLALPWAIRAKVE